MDIEAILEMYEDDYNPSSTVPGPRNMYNQGQLVQPNADGSRPGYSGEKKLNKTMKKRIATYDEWAKKNNKPSYASGELPNWKKYDIREDNWTGEGKGARFKEPAFMKAIKSEGSAIQQVRDYLNNSLKQNKGKPVFFKTIPEIKKLAGVTKTGKGIDGDISRALTGMFKDKVLLRNFDKLPNEVIDEVKTNFSDIISKDQWNFDKYRFGVNKEEFTNKVYDRIRSYVQDPKPTRYGFGFNKPEGWMLVQMDRAWRSGNKNYKPIYRTDGRVIGYVDKTASGQGKKWFVSKDYIKGKNSDGLLLGGGENYDAHLDFTENKKYHDIVQKAGKQPNRAITQILKDGGIDQKVQLRHIVNYLLDNSDLSTTKNSIVRHHRGSLQNATQDLQILNRIQNAKVIGIEKRIKDGIIKPDDIAKLNKFGVSVRDPNTGTLYGKGPTTAEGGLKKINELVLKGSTNQELYGKDIKGLQDFKKKDFNKLKQYLSDLGCPKSLQKASGGRIKYSNGTSCAIKGREVLEKGLKNGFKNADVGLAQKILGTGKFLKDAVSLRGLFGPAALAFTAAAEAGIVGYDMLASGKSFKEAVGVSIFNYALGDKTKIDSDEEFMKRLKNIKVGPQGYQRMGEAEIGKMMAFKSALDDINYGGDLYKQLNAITENRKQIDSNPEDAFNQNAFQLDLDRQEDKVRADIRDFNKVGIPDKLLGVDYEGGAKATELANLLVKQDQLKDAGTAGALPKIDEGVARDLKQTKYGIENLFKGPTGYEGAVPSEMSYIMSKIKNEPDNNYGLFGPAQLMEGGIASLNVNKK